MAGFDNPLFPSQFDVGTPGGSHTHIDGSGIVMYGADGITPVVSLLLTPTPHISVTDSAGRSVQLSPAGDPSTPFSGAANISFLTDATHPVPGGIWASQGTLQATSPWNTGTPGFYGLLNLTSATAAGDAPTAFLGTYGGSGVWVYGNRSGGTQPDSSVALRSNAHFGGPRDLIWDGTNLTPPNALPFVANRLSGAWSVDSQFFVDGLNGFYNRIAHARAFNKTVQLQGKIATTGPSLGRLAVYSFFDAGLFNTWDNHVVGNWYCGDGTIGVCFVNTASGKVEFLGNGGTFVGDAGHTIAAGTNLYFYIETEIP